MSQEWSSLPLQGGSELLAWNHNVICDLRKPVPGIIAAGILLCQRVLYSSTVKPHQCRRGQVGSSTFCMDFELLGFSWAGSKSDVQKAADFQNAKAKTIRELY